MLIFKEMEIENSNHDVKNIEATLEELILALRKLNTKKAGRKEEIVRVNQQTRELLEQIYSSLKAA
jgi:peptidoglycan hydrolase CwlO-like protein